MLKSSLTMFFAVSATIAVAGESDIVWQTNLPKALQQAERESKLVLIDFTGSDWCTACIKLRREILEQDEFKAWARKKFVFVEVDIPHKKKLPGDLLARNKAIAEKYNVVGFPTIMVLTPQGRVAGGFLGYADSVKTAIAHLENAMTAAEGLKKSASLQGVDKARVLMDAYRVFPSGKAFDEPRSELREEIMKLDPKNSTGIHHDDAVHAQAIEFMNARENSPRNSAAFGELLEKQLATAYPENKVAVFVEKCQYSLSMAETVEDLEKTKILFEELLKMQTGEEAEETQFYLDKFFSDLPSLLQMLKQNRPR